jgi:hypothetical protein
MSLQQTMTLVAQSQNGASVDNVARGLAVVSICLSAAGLAWQVISWVRTGSLVRVESNITIVAGRGPEPNWVRCFGVDVMNIGRTPMTVRQVGTKLPDGTTFYPTDLKLEGWKDRFPLPYRLEPNASAHWYFPLESFDFVPGRFGAKARVRAYVWVANGKQPVSKKGMRVDERPYNSGQAREDETGVVTSAP